MRNFSHYITDDTMGRRKHYFHTVIKKVVVLVGVGGT